jgi:hypothetical protein
VYDWISGHELIFWWTGFLSLGVLTVSLILLPVVVVRLPEDYFIREKGRKSRSSRQTLSGRLVILGRNLLGGLLVLAGMAMLLTPGQGLLSIAVGIGLMDFPRKKLLLRKLIGRERIIGTLNRLRSRFERPPLQTPE